MVQELAADPERRWRFRDDSPVRIIDPGAVQTYLFVFSADHLGKGKRLFLYLPSDIFDERKFNQVIRFNQSEVQTLPTNPPPSTAPKDEPPLQSNPELEAKLSALESQLAKGKTAADRMKAADELCGTGHEGEAGDGCPLPVLFDPSPQVQVTAMGTGQGGQPEGPRPRRHAGRAVDRGRLPVHGVHGPAEGGGRAREARSRGPGARCPCCCGTRSRSASPAVGCVARPGGPGQGGPRRPGRGDTPGAEPLCDDHGPCGDGGRGPLVHDPHERVWWPRWGRRRGPTRSQRCGWRP